MIRHDDVATERPYVLGHFAGSTIAFLNLRYVDHKEIRWDRRCAREISFITDHFARHEQLPTGFPREDYMI